MRVLLSLLLLLSAPAAAQDNAVIKPLSMVDDAVVRLSDLFETSGPRAGVVLGPAPAPLSMLRGRYRFRLLVHARRSADVQGMIRGWLAGIEVPSAVRVAVDIDPHSFL